MITLTISAARPSHEDIFAARSAALDKIKAHATAITHLGEALADVDAALVMAIDSRSVDESQGLIDAARRLAGLLTVEGTR